MIQCLVRAAALTDGVGGQVWEWKREYGSTITMQLRRLGASCDWSREAFTLDSQLSSAVVEAFSRLHDKVRHGGGAVPPCPDDRSA